LINGSTSTRTTGSPLLSRPLSGLLDLTHRVTTSMRISYSFVSFVLSLGFAAAAVIPVHRDGAVVNVVQDHVDKDNGGIVGRDNPISPTPNGSGTTSNDPGSTGEMDALAAALSQLVSEVGGMEQGVGNVRLISQKLASSWLTTRLSFSHRDTERIFV
ncbi:hypothetical protein EV363DRAFT_1344736, partial [Boletus edulis]